MSGIDKSIYFTLKMKKILYVPNLKSWSSFKKSSRAGTRLSVTNDMRVRFMAI